MKKQHFTLMVLFLFTISVYAQNAADSLTPKTILKVSPLHLVDFYPTHQFALEQRVFPGVTSQLDFGVVRNNYDPENRYQRKRGVKGRLAGRYYFWGRMDRRKVYYGEVEGYMNIINFDRQEEVVDCLDPDCLSRQTTTYNFQVNYREQGLSLKAGMLKYFSPKWVVDFNAGFALRFVDYQKPNFDLKFQTHTTDFPIPLEPNEKKRIGFSPVFGVRFGYCIR
jgi:hypothetical protein